MSRAVVASLPPPEEVLSVVRVADTLVLGTTQGLATVHSGTVVPVETKEVSSSPDYHHTNTNASP